MPDLATTYLGLHLTSPLVPSASPLSRNLETIKRLEEAGAAAVVLYSLFEEQIDQESHALDRYLSAGAESFWEAQSYYPEPDEYTLHPDEYLEHLRRAKAAVDIPIIASLNGVSPGGWTRYARLIEEAGADALELNVYVVPTDPLLASAAIEQNVVALVREVKRSIDIPVAVKLSPFYTNVAGLALRLAGEGADGLVLFNRFNQPDFDLEALDVVPRPLISRDGDGEALRLPLRWIAILHELVPIDLAGSGGVHTAQDALKLLLAGADVTMLASALLLHGPDRLRQIRADLLAWLDEHEYESVSQLRGSMSRHRVADPSAFERAHYVRTVGTYDIISHPVRPGPTPAHTSR
jgi:dihydroorotate dehydrogenase (fumarate)